MSDTLMRQWQMLRLIPRFPSKISTSELIQRLGDEGYKTSSRTLQRDLIRLSRIYPLQCDDRNKPYGWSWAQDAGMLEVPGMDADMALTFYLAQKHLEPLLPRTSVERLQGHFRRAKEVLDLTGANQGNPAWRNKVRVLHRGPGLKKPAIVPEVQSAVYDALLRNRRLDVSYMPRGAAEIKHYELNPLGLVSKDGLLYLVCSMWDYADIRLLTLHRMSEAKALDVPCSIPAGFDLDEYIASGELDFAIAGSINLKLRISKQVAIHLQERPLNEGQTLTESDGGEYILEAETQDTSELRWWLLGFGDQVEVLAPENIRSEIKNIADNMSEKYS